MCIYLLLEKLSDDCANDFSKFGGLRIVKRWLRIAEENDRVPEMTVLVKLCNKLPFNELAVKEVGIGKIIRKLLKFQSPSGSDVTNLHAEIEKLMANWRAKQMEIVSNRALQNAVTETAHAAKVTSSDKPLSGLVLAISDRLTQQRGHPTTATPHSQDMAHQRGVDSNESKGDSVMVKNEYAPFRHSIQNSLPSPRVANSNNSPTGSTATSRLDLHRSSNSAEGSDAMRNTTHRPVSVLPMLQRAGAASAAPVPQVDSASSAPARVVGLDLTSTSAAPATPTPLAVVKPPMAVRERKPLDMAESARKLLAMRAQQAQPAGLGTDGNGSPVHSYTSSEPSMSPSTANVLSILSAVGKARIASGLMPQPIQVYSLFLNFLHLFFVCCIAHYFTSLRCRCLHERKIEIYGYAEEPKRVNEYDESFP